MEYLEFCREILELSDPWRVRSVEIDQPAKRLDIYLGFGAYRKKNLFGIVGKRGLLRKSGQIKCPHCNSVLPNDGDFDTVCLRHLPIAGFNSYLHVPFPGTVHSSQPDCFCMKRWASADSSITKAMHDFIVTLLGSVTSDATTAKLTGISEKELGALRKAAGLAPQESVRRDVSFTLNDTDILEGTTEDVGEIYSIPDETDLVWTLLMDGKVPMKTDSLALRMMLQRIRVDLEKEDMEEKRLDWRQTLRMFFLKNKQLLKREVEILNNQKVLQDSGTTVEQRRKPELPSENDPVWQRLINGDIEIQTDTMSLKMLLSRARQIVIRKPTRETRLECARTLRQFFVKNRSRLTAEVDGLLGAGSEVREQQAVCDERGGVVPSIAHPGWQRLIDGELKIVTNTVALNMMLQRVRQYMEKNPSEATRLACTKLLRHYFIKHQNRHKQEIEQVRAS